MASRVSNKIKLTSIDELLCVPNTDGTMEIEIEKIYPFENHPFKVLDDERMNELVESVRSNGVISPVLIRPDDEGSYEMISGHRRLHAATFAGLTKIPAFIKEMTDDEAVIAMVDGNLQREEVLPSEKAFSLKMKMDAIRHQGTCRTECDKLETRKSCDEVGEGFGIKGRQVQKYVRLTELNTDLLDLVDNKKLQIGLAVEISYFDKEVQAWLYEYIKENGTIRPEQVASLKAQENLENLTQYMVINIINGAITVKGPTKKVMLTEKKLDKYFPADYSGKKREQIIIELLEKWKAEQM